MWNYSARRRFFEIQKFLERDIDKLLKKKTVPSISLIEAGYNADF
jgi:hypothetical protein